MRITGGSARGIPISSGKSSMIRPATDRMRESVFSSLGNLVNEATCLDLCAGTGAYGLEAISRGAKSCTFVEKDFRSITAIQGNVKALEKSLGHRIETTIKKMDVLQWQLSERVDLIFIDPPYPIWQNLMTVLAPKFDLFLNLNENARLICEAPTGQSISIPALNLYKTLGGKKNHDPSVQLFSRG